MDFSWVFPNQPHRNVVDVGLPIQATWRESTKKYAVMFEAWKCISIYTVKHSIYVEHLHYHHCMVLVHDVQNGWGQEEPQWEAYVHISAKSNHAGIIYAHILRLYKQAVSLVEPEE